MDIAVVSGSPREHGRSRVLARRLAGLVQEAAPGTRVELIDLAGEPVEPFRGFDATYDEVTRQTVEHLTWADGLLIVSPVYNTTFSAAVKNLFEHVNYKALSGRVAGLVLVGGSERSFVNAQGDLMTLMGYFDVMPIPKAVFVTEDQVTEDVASDEAEARLRALVARLLTELRVRAVHLEAAAEMTVPPE